MTWLWLGIWLTGFAASLAAHEVGHVIVGKHFGWEVAGIRLRYLLLGAGVQMGHRGQDPAAWRLGIVSVAGPCATLLTSAVFIGLAQLPIEHNWIFGSLAAFNFALFVVSLLPLPATDGGTILQALTGWTMRWRYAGAAWLTAEICTALAMLVQHTVA